MNVVACAAPQGSIEPAPMTSFPIERGDDTVSCAAFWAGDDDYFVRVDGPRGTQWYRVDAERPAESEATEAARAACGALLADIIPLGGGRVAFPVGSAGRTVFRVWRSRGADARPTRTRILAVRAARSRRLPA